MKTSDQPGLIYTPNLQRGEQDREALTPLVPDRVPAIEIVKDLEAWTPIQPPSFLKIGGSAYGDVREVCHEAEALCRRVRNTWPNFPYHVGLLQDVPRFSLDLLANGAYDVFLDLRPSQVALWRQNEQIAYNPDERVRLFMSIDRFLEGRRSPRKLRLTTEHVPRQEGEWFLLYDTDTPLVWERLHTLCEVIEHHRGHPRGIRLVSTAAFSSFETLEALLDQVALICYLIVPGSTPAFFTREALVQQLERLERRPAFHEFEDRSVPVIYITPMAGDYRYLPENRRFRCGSNVAVASLFSHALQR